MHAGETSGDSPTSTPATNSGATSSAATAVAAAFASGRRSGGSSGVGGAPGGDDGDDGGDGDGSRPDNDPLPSQRGARQQPNIPSIERLRGLPEDAQLVALGLRYSDMSQCPQRSPEWFQARVCRITASEAAVFTEALPVMWHKETPKQLIIKKVQQKVKWAADIDAGRQPDFSADVSATAQRRMAIGVEQEQAGVEAYLDHMARQQDGFKYTAETIGLVVSQDHPWLAASPDRKIHAVRYPLPGDGSSAHGDRAEFLLEVKVCVDSDIPDSLPEYVRRQVMVQLHATNMPRCDVCFYKEGHAPKVFSVVWDFEKSHWDSILQRLRWHFFKDLAPAIIHQRAVAGRLSPEMLAVIEANLPPPGLAGTQAEADALDELAMLEAAQLQLAIVKAHAATVDASSWTHVVHIQHPEWGIGQIVAEAGGPPNKFKVAFPGNLPKSKGRGKKSSGDDPVAKLAGRTRYAKQLLRPVFLDGATEVQPVDPQQVGQVVQVVGGDHAGAYGVTVKFNAAMWTLKSEDGSSKRVAPKHLHVLGGPKLRLDNHAITSGHVFYQPPGGRPLHNNLQVPLQELPDWVDEYQHNPTAPMELVVVENRRRVDAHRPTDARAAVLSDITNTQTMPPTSSTPEAGPEGTTEVAEVEQCAGVLPTGDVDSEWTLRYGCRRGHARCGRQVSQLKCVDCKFDLVVKHEAGAPNVLITERTYHTNHDVGDAAQASYLKPTEQGRLQVCCLLEAGVKPKKNCDVLNRQMDEQMRGCSSKDYIKSFLDPRQRWTTAMVVAERKAWMRSRMAGADWLPDSQQVKHMVDPQTGIYKDYTVWYQPYQPAASDQEEPTPFVLIMASPFQLAMLNEFGRLLTHMDGTGGTNKNGFLLVTMLVVDECNNGCPTGYMITSSQDADVHQTFIEKMRDAVRNKVASGADFDFNKFMIDKSTTEMAAIRAALGRDAYLLCYFHLLQEWERYARRADGGGVKTPDERSSLLRWIERLAHCTNKRDFKRLEKEFYAEWTRLGYTAVVDNYKANWATRSEHWAHWGREDVMELNRHTNNHLERAQGQFKYDHLDRETKKSVPALIETIVTKVEPRYVHDRAEKLGRGRESKAVMAQASKLAAAEALVAGNQLTLVDQELGVVHVACESAGFYTVCMAELSCECADHRRHNVVCKHIQAVQLHTQLPSLTHGMRIAAAAKLLQSGCIKPISSAKSKSAGQLHDCPSLVGLDGGSAPTPKYTISPHDPYCSCMGFKLHGICPHLMAAAQLQDLQGVISTAPWDTLDDSTTLDVIPAQGTARRPGFVEPLTDEVLESVQQRQRLQQPEQVPRSVLVRNADANTPFARLKRRMEGLLQKLKGASSEVHAEILEKWGPFEADALELHQAQSLPLTHQRLASQVNSNWRRNPDDRKTKALFPGRTRKALADAVVQQALSVRASNKQRRALSVAGIRQAIQLGQLDPMAAPLLTVRDRREKTRIAGIQHGGNWRKAATASHAQKRSKAYGGGEARKSKRFKATTKPMQ